MVGFVRDKQLILKSQLVLKPAIAFRCRAVAKLALVVAQRVIYM